MKIARLTELEKQWVVVGAAGAVALLIGVLLLVIPAVNKSTRLNQEAGQVDRKIDVLKDIQVYSAQLREMEKGIKPFVEKHLVMEAVTGAANRNKLEVDSVQPEFETETHAGYRGAKVIFQGNGEFKSLMLFLKDLDKTGFPVAVNNFNLELVQGNRKKEERSLKVQMNVATLMSVEGK